eukprot:2205569-Pleurochrysis_carterae.AAC.1
MKVCRREVKEVGLDRWREAVSLHLPQLNGEETCCTSSCDDPPAVVDTPPATLSSNAELHVLARLWNCGDVQLYVTLLLNLLRITNA